MSVILTDKIQPRTTGIAVTLAGDLDVTGAVSVAGTITYEDVTNVDSVGLITARSGVNLSGGQLTVGTGVTIGVAGIATFRTGRIDVGDSLSNTSIGQGAGDSYTTGTNNTAVGKNALTAITTGERNTAFGVQALGGTATGVTNNTAVGVNALYNTTGSSNTACGDAALYTNTSGANNIGMGRNALLPTPTFLTPVVLAANA